MNKLSVVIPVYNAAGTLAECLKAIRLNDLADVEVLLVDDSSTDQSCKIARQFGFPVVLNSHRKGPAGARNSGAEIARGQILLFVDADVRVQDNTLSKVLAVFDQDAAPAAVFGSYDDAPSADNFLSQYKNLFHHFVHQSSPEEAVTFWAGCGAIRKDIFLALGGFDDQKYSRASIEDIELGLRLFRKQYRIRLDKSLQVKHLKRWNCRNLLKADVLYRAYPWSKLILQSGMLPGHLNLQSSFRLSAALASLALLMFIFGIVNIPSWPAPVSLVSAALLILFLLFLNRHQYQFFLRRRGFLFTLAAIPWHIFYYLYSGATFAFCWLTHHVHGLIGLRVSAQGAPTSGLQKE